MSSPSCANRRNVVESVAANQGMVQAPEGHKSSTMIAKYRRAARMAAEVGMGPLVRMDVAVGLVAS